MTDTLPPLLPECAEWEHLKGYGYAPGDYMNRCHRCKQVVTGVDKRATTCRPCAEAMAGARATVDLVPPESVTLPPVKWKVGADPVLPVDDGSSARTERRNQGSRYSTHLAAVVRVLATNVPDLGTILPT